VKQSLALVLHDLPLVDQSGLVVAEINLVLNAVGGVDNRLDCRVYDSTGVHVDFDFVADFGLFFSFSGMRRDSTTQPCRTTRLRVYQHSLNLPSENLARIVLAQRTTCYF
jgi:hypothetical protein